MVTIFNPERPSEEIASSSASKKTQSVVSEEIIEILQKILMEQIDANSSEDETAIKAPRGLHS